MPTDRKVSREDVLATIDPQEVVDLAETQIYHRVQRGITELSQAIRDRSTGRIHGYIGWVFGTLVVALLLFGASR